MSKEVFWLRAMARKVFGLAGVAIKVFWRSRNSKKVFWHSRNCYTSVLVYQEWKANCFGDAQPRSKGRTKYGDHL